MSFAPASRLFLLLPLVERDRIRNQGDPGTADVDFETVVTAARSNVGHGDIA